MDFILSFYCFTAFLRSFLASEEGQIGAKIQKRKLQKIFASIFFLLFFH